jgi:hypothetical protein
MSHPADIISPGDLITVEELARRLAWSSKTVQNKMSGKERIFIRGIHYDSPPGMPTLFRWSAVLALYRFDGEKPAPTAAAGARMPGNSQRLKSA